MGDENFAVHDIMQRDTTDLTPQGVAVEMRVVTFFVGPNGPFTLRYTKAEATGERIQRDINAEVVLLRNTHAAFTGSQL